MSRPALIEALLNPARYPHPVAQVRLVETHISYVLLTGQFAYKIKKAVNLGFLDFSTLAQRRFFCEEELRLNRRLAPELYLAVVAIGGPPERPRIEADTEADTAVVEYAVKMREFPQAALFDRLLAKGTLFTGQIDALADQVASFHARLPRAVDHSHGTPAAIWAPVAQNFSQLHGNLLISDDPIADRALLDALKIWSRDEYLRLHGFLLNRQHGGFVRECHGDLHLGNVAQVGGMPVIFDGIEFNPGLRWIDVMSEVAFLSMDLQERGRPDYSQRFLNRYLEATGDYAGLRVLPFYRVYRALVRAKVAHIRALQAPATEHFKHATRCAQYLNFAWQACLPQRRHLLLMVGVSGSGKTWLSQAILERTGAVRLRSDIERKRLAALPADAHSASVVAGGLYAAKATRATYQRLFRLARVILEAGYPVLIDAANLKFWQRRLFRSLARSLDVPFLIVACHAPESILHRRLLARAQVGLDASEADIAVLHHQLQNSDPLSTEEQALSLSIDSGYMPLDDILRRIEQEISP